MADRKPLPALGGDEDVELERLWRALAVAERLGVLRWAAVMTVPLACCSVLPIMTATASPTPSSMLIRAGEVCFLAGLAGLLAIAFGSMWLQWSQRRLAEPHGRLAGASLLVGLALVAGAGLIAPSGPAIGAAVAVLAAGGTGWVLDRRWRRLLNELRSLPRQMPVQ
jgi:hypothetical protein